MSAADPTADAVEIIGRRSSLFTRVATMFADTLRLPWKLTHVADLAALWAASFAVRAARAAVVFVARSVQAAEVVPMATAFVVKVGT